MKSLVLFLLFISFSFSNAENHWFAHLGLSSSTFRDSHNFDNIEPIQGYLLGIGKEWSFSNKFFISAGIQYSLKGAILKSKLIYPINDFQTTMDIYKQDIIGKIGFIEIPIHLKHGFNFKYFCFKIYGGINYSIPFRDYTVLEKNTLWLADANPDDYKNHFEYDEWEESGFGNNNAAFIYDFGIEFLYKRIGLNLMYSLDSRDVWWFDSISEIYKSMYSYSLSLILYL
jgi:hypothetical protein